MFDIDAKMKKLERISLLAKVGNDGSKDIEDDLNLSRLSSDVLIQMHLEMQTFLLYEIMQEVSKEK